MESKRKYPRFNCNGSADMVDGTNARCWGHLGDISLGGFYVSTFAPWPINTEVRFKLEIDDKLILGTGVVATSHPGVGMAVVYENLAPENQSALEEVVAGLERAGAETSGSGLRV